MMGKDNDFSVFIKSGHVLYCFSSFVYSRLKAFGNKRENKTHGILSQSTVVAGMISGEQKLVIMNCFARKYRICKNIPQDHNFQKFKVGRCRAVNLFPVPLIKLKIF